MNIISYTHRGRQSSGKMVEEEQDSEWTGYENNHDNGEEHKPKQMQT